MQTYSFSFGGSLFPGMKHTQQAQIQAKPYASLASNDILSLSKKNSVRFGADSENDESKTPTFDRLTSQESLIYKTNVNRKELATAWKERCPDETCGSFLGILNKTRTDKGLPRLNRGGLKAQSFQRALKSEFNVVIAL